MQWPTRVYRSADHIVIASVEDSILVLLRRTRFVARYEACPNPNTRCAIASMQESALTAGKKALEAVYARAAAKPRPSATPPAATTMTGSPVRGLIASLQRSTTAGISIEKGVSPVWPPPSPPCAQMMSTPILESLLGVDSNTKQADLEQALLRRASTEVSDCEH